MLAAPERLTRMALAEPRRTDPAHVAEASMPDDLLVEIPELVSTGEVGWELLPVACVPVLNEWNLADPRSPDRWLDQLVVSHVQTDCCAGMFREQISE